jgi:hypothetical protein
VGGARGRAARLVNYRPAGRDLWPWLQQEGGGLGSSGEPGEVGAATPERIPSSQGLAGETTLMVIGCDVFICKSNINTVTIASIESLRAELC